MRVTKIIREYVEKEVCKRVPLPQKPNKIVELEKEWEDFNAMLKQQVADKYADFFAAHKGECAPYYCDENLNDLDAICNYLDEHARVNCGSNSITIAASRDYEKARKAVIENRRQIIDDVLVSLELGANRADLEEMLSKIG